jgi:hypothetical protein
VGTTTGTWNVSLAAGTYRLIVRDNLVGYYGAGNYTVWWQPASGLCP